MAPENVCQRWRTRRDSYRPAGQPINTLSYDVAALDRDVVAKSFVTTHHYSASYPAARYRFGLYHAAELVGVAVFSHPCHDRVLTAVFPGSAVDAVELGRFVLLDSVPSNGETWFLGRCFSALRKIGLRGIVAFSDPEPRSTLGGELVFPGHVGTIYQAHNARYLGRGRGQSLRLLPDGRALPQRSLRKIRAGVRGWRAAAAVLEAHGADAPWTDRGAWLAHWEPLLLRRMPHRGAHKYAWSLRDRSMSAVPAAYPKALHDL